MKSIPLVLMLVLGALAMSDARAQASVSFDVDLSSPLAPVATWSTTPAGGQCTAVGDWSGDLGDSGTQVLPAIRTSVDFGIECRFPGDSMATLTWDNPTENDDGSPYTNGLATRIVWTSGGDLSSFDCLDPDASGLSYTDRPYPQTMHTVTGLGPPGATFEFQAYAVNDLNLCSLASNVATKMLQGEIIVTDSVSIRVPAAPANFAVQS